MATNLIEKDYESFNYVLNKANREELDVLLSILEKEIRLSEQAIKEGFEKRGGS